MDHQPYEKWLLDDERLTPEQNRDLRLHLKSCIACSALAFANLELRSAGVVAPQAGFGLRFQARLVSLQRVQSRRAWIGMFLLAFLGLTGFLWLFSPYLFFLGLPPTRLAGWWISNLVYLALAVHTLGALVNTLSGVLSALVPAYVWPLALALTCGMVFLWTVSVKKVGKSMQSAV